MRSLFFVLMIGCGSEAKPAGQVGAACAADSDCKQMGASCILPGTNSTWDGGYCTVKGCPAVACPDGTFCQQGNTKLGNTTCFLKCTTEADCRTGYRCCESTMPTGTKVCAAPGVLCP